MAWGHLVCAIGVNLGDGLEKPRNPNSVSGAQRNSVSSPERGSRDVAGRSGYCVAGCVRGSTRNCASRRRWQLEWRPHIFGLVVPVWCRKVAR